MLFALLLWFGYTFPTVKSVQGVQLNPLLPLMQILVQKAGPALSEILGMNGPRTYLILVQNNHELRATGGFITAVGKVVLENGSLRELDFVDSYEFFNAELEYPPAPQPMQRHMGIQLLLLRDANWSPDLPTTARLIKSLYAQQTGIDVSGVITLDLHAAELIVDALGPLQLPGVATPVTGDNFAEQVAEFWQKPPGTDVERSTSEFWEWWGQRKDFMAELATVALQRLEAGNVNYAKLLLNSQRALSERSIQIWLTEPTIAKQLANLGWDGALRPQPKTDFLALVDTNMGYNKVDAVLQRSLRYEVAWPDGPDQPGVATATITYTHPLDLPNYTCINGPEHGANYAYMIERCYYDYVRLYVPAGSELVTATGLDAESITSQRGEKNTQIFGGFFTLPTGEQHLVSFTYRLPPNLTPAHYALRVQRQAGSGPLPLPLPSVRKISPQPWPKLH